MALYKQNELPKGASVAYICKADVRRKHCVHNKEWTCSWPECKHTTDEKYALYPRKDRIFKEVARNRFMEVDHAQDAN